ncbi:hypothetical protein AB833_12470 [Chromatiales bacterium (ex Bugula neritina AB1)]|nr:hypothetical protein AB833_12470 [Chromatiales bacterium (ex Bugula neritina AB1)]
MRATKLATCIAGALMTCSLISVAEAAPPASLNLAPSYPERPVPLRGEDRETVLQTVGQPAARQAGIGDTEVWDYGTFRVFFRGDKVAFTRVW